MKKEKFKVLSLFSGAMGLDIGFEKTGFFEILACVEKEKTFCDTMRANLEAGNIENKNLQILNFDLSITKPEVVAKILKIRPNEIDVIIGGPPCQSFSTAGKRGTVQDPRGTLLWRFLDFISYFKPKAFLIENVRGLESAALKHRPIKERPEHGGAPLKDDETPGSVLKQFVSDLRNVEKKYRLDAFLVNAVNYGAPQLRERLLIIGNKVGRKINFPSPTHGNGPSDQAEIFNGHPLKPFRTLGDALKGLKERNPTVLDFSERKKKYLSLVPPGSNWRSLPIQVQKESMGKAFFSKGGRSGWWRRLSYHLPCPTLCTMPNHAGTALCHPEFVRALSIKEYALIQEFPKNWIFCGKTQEQYAQAGNAVPVRLAEVAAGLIAELLRFPTKYDNYKINGVETSFSIEYIKSHIRTRQWFKKGDVIVLNSSGKNLKNVMLTMKTERAQRVLK